MRPLIDGDDGLPATEVGEWAKQKHEYLRRYLDISSAARKKFLNGRSRSATFIDLFCGPGRARIPARRRRGVRGGTTPQEHGRNPHQARGVKGMVMSNLNHITARKIWALGARNALDAVAEKKGSN